ncbi:MAG: hypothetical protein AAF483_06735, partial [Planctomycetota bacterium]
MQLRKPFYRRRFFHRCVTFLTLFAVLFGNMTFGLADDKFGGFFRAIRRGLRNSDEKHHERVEPNACTHAGVEELAGQLDWLEHHIEIYGSVIPKQPDIWGEARLTRHRQQVEEELEKQLTQFGDSIQGSLSRSDQSSLSFMLALGSVLGEGGSAPSTSISTSVDANTGGDEPDASSSVTPSSPGTTTTSFAAEKSKFGINDITLEPTIHNDQLYRYLNALNTLRRLNEGDDTADAPGYALNLIRLPASVLPGRRTRQGYGAEVSYTIRPHLGDDLLPNTFRSLAINDQVDQLSLLVKRLLEQDKPNDDIAPLEPLGAYVQAERSAQVIVQAFYDRLERLYHQLQEHGDLQDSGWEYFHFLNQRREYLRNRIVQIETAWRFEDVFSEGDKEAGVVTYNLGKLDLGGAGPGIDFAVNVSVQKIRNALYRLLATGIAITEADVVITLGEGQDPITLPLHFVLTERELAASQVSKDELPYRVWLPIAHLNATSELISSELKENTVPAAIAGQHWFDQTLRQLESCQPQINWLDYRAQIIAEINHHVDKNLLTIAKGGLKIAGQLDEGETKVLAFADVEKIASQASSTVKLSPINGSALQNTLEEVEQVIALVHLLRMLPEEVEKVEEKIEAKLRENPALEAEKIGDKDPIFGDLKAALANIKEQIASAPECIDFADPDSRNSALTSIENLVTALWKTSANLKSPNQPVDPGDNQGDPNGGQRVETMISWLRGIAKSANAIATAAVEQANREVLVDSWARIEPQLKKVSVEELRGVSSAVLQLVPGVVALSQEQLDELGEVLPCLKPIANRVEDVSRVAPGFTTDFEAKQREIRRQSRGGDSEDLPPPEADNVNFIQPAAFKIEEAKSPFVSLATPAIKSATSPVAGIGATPYRGQFSLHAQSLVANKLGTGIVFSSPTRTQGLSHPMAPSIVLGVYGHEVVLEIAILVEGVLRNSPPNLYHYKLMEDIRRLLIYELEEAYEFLNTEALRGSWQFAGHDLEQAIRRKDTETIRRIREDFFRSLPAGVAKTITGALAWSIIVESSLLNQRLIEDMRAVADSKGCACGDVDGFCFWGPNPPSQSRATFNEYVLTKWPIQVFTVDPASQEQNIADSYNVTRELQLAAAVAAATGEVSLSAAAEFSRSIQVNVDTIDLNRTAVGFTHGNDTFGWRYYPRLQSPGTTGLIATIGQTIMGGPGRDSLIRQRMLEPGVRESVAVVVMPSFIPYVTLESRSSWFHLNDPADKELTVKDSMRLSSAQQAIQNFMNCAQDCGCYRPGDVAHMSTILDQLSKRLPLQRTQLQVPYENSAGGYKIFRSGVRGLAPELTGWYGAP